MNTYFTDESGAIYRMITKDAEQLLLIDISATRKPVWKNPADLKESDIPAGTLPETDAELTAKQERIMRQRFTMISGILPLVGNDKKMNAAIKRTAEEYDVIYRVVRTKKDSCLFYNFRKNKVKFRRCLSGNR